MKKSVIFFVIFIFSASVGYSATNQEIIDRLDEIQFENQMNREIDKINRDTDRMSRQSQIPSNYHYIGKSVKNSMYFVDDNTIRRLRNGLTEVMIYVSHDVPQYYGNKTFFNEMTYYDFKCNVRKVSRSVSTLMNRQGNPVGEITKIGDLQDVKSGSVIEQVYNYVCR